MKIAILDKVHPLFVEKFTQNGWICENHHESTREELLKIIDQYNGIILRSRIKMDEDFLSHCSNLKFIGRPGAGLENIDLEYCSKKNISVFRSPEGNCDAVGEHVIGSLLSLFNNLKKADSEVRNGIWLREENRGFELKGKTFAIIGYGYMGEAVAKKLKGFEVNVIAYDKYKTNFSNDFVKEVTLNEIYETANIVSLHTPLTIETIGLVNSSFINQFKKSFYLINTARGKSVITKDLVLAIENGKIKGACLDVFDFESTTFENSDTQSDDYKSISSLSSIVLSPHIAGWTFEAKEKMASYLIDKIIHQFTF